jgi:hypothetical protein
MLTSPAKLPFNVGWCYHPRQKDPLLSQVVTKRRKSVCMALPREIPLLSRVMRPPVTKWGPLVTVGNTTRDKRWGVLYKPCRLPDRHLTVFPQSVASSSIIVVDASPRRVRPRCAPPRQEAPLRRASLLRCVVLPDATPFPGTRASPSLAAGELGRADVRPSPCAVRPRHGAPSRRTSPPRLDTLSLPRRRWRQPPSPPSSTSAASPKRSIRILHDHTSWLARPVCCAAAAGRRMCAPMADRAARWGWHQQAFLI